MFEVVNKLLVCLSVQGIQNKILLKFTDEPSERQKARSD